MGLHILGDSHGLFNFAGVAGATIHFHSGVTMHRAARDGIRSLLPRFFRLRSDDALVLVFGEVDCRAHIPRLSKKHGRSSLEETDALCARFAAAVHDFKGTTTATVATCSVVPFCHGHREKAYESDAECVRDAKAIRDRINERLAGIGVPFVDYRAPFTEPDGSIITALSDNNIHIHSRHSAPVVDAVNEALGLAETFQEPLAYPPYNRAYYPPLKRLHREFRAGLRRLRGKPPPMHY